MPMSPLFDFARQVATEEVEAMDVVDHSFAYRCQRCGYSGTASVIAAGSATAVGDSFTHDVAAHAEANRSAADAAQRRAKHLADTARCPSCKALSRAGRLHRAVQGFFVAVPTLLASALAIGMVAWREPLVAAVLVVVGAVLSLIRWQRSSREALLADGAVVFVDQAAQR